MSVNSSAPIERFYEALRDFELGPPPEAQCERCPHNWGKHMLQSFRTPPLSGTITCPVEGCECIGTWDAPQLIIKIAEEN